MTPAVAGSRPPRGTLHFTSLGSGSKGNATLVADGETHVLVDCGFGLRDTERRLEGLGLHPRQLDAILVSHEHGDHVRGVGLLARRYGMPVYLTHGTWGSGRLGDLPDRRWITPQVSFSIKGLTVDPVTIPHDAREPVQFRFRAGARSLGVLTDLGHATEHVIEAFAGCDALVLECNHDLRMLAEGPYPAVLKRRVGGNWGHLANVQASALLVRLGLDRLQRIVCSHLSQHNNRPDLVLEALVPLLDGDESRLMVAAQGESLAWQAIG